MLRIALVTIALTLGNAWAKLPAPPPMTDAQKSAAEAAKSKAAETAKKEGELLAKYMDKAVANYKKGHAGPGKAAASAKPKK